MFKKNFCFQMTAYFLFEIMRNSKHIKHSSSEKQLTQNPIQNKNMHQ